MGCFCRWGYSSVPRDAVSISLLLSARHCCLHMSLKYQAIMIDASCMRHAPCCPGWYTVASVQDTGRASVSDTEACVCFYKRVRCRGVAVRGLHAPRRVACVCMQFTGQQGTNATRAVCAAVVWHMLLAGGQLGWWEPGLVDEACVRASRVDLGWFWDCGYYCTCWAVSPTGHRGEERALHHALRRGARFAGLLERN